MTRLAGGLDGRMQMILAVDMLAVHDRAGWRCDPAMRVRGRVRRWQKDGCEAGVSKRGDRDEVSLHGRHDKSRREGDRLRGTSGSEVEGADVRGVDDRPIANHDRLLVRTGRDDERDVVDKRERRTAIQDKSWSGKRGRS